MERRGINQQGGKKRDKPAGMEGRGINQQGGKKNGKAEGLERMNDMYLEFDRRRQ